MTDSPHRYLGEALDRILDEVAGFQVDLAPDPTLPELGSKYLNDSLAKCRNFTNRTLHYLQMMKRQERDIRMEVKLAEADLDFKLKEKLADDPVVRNQPAVEDRVALATVSLREEHVELAALRKDLMETEDTVKLIKARLDNLRQTSFDIKLQRQIVRDDREAWGSSDPGGGYSSPQRNKDKTVPDGMQAPVRPAIDPQDLLDPKRRPADMPVPVDDVHAAQIANFFNSSEDVGAEESKAPAEPEPPPQAAARPVSYESLMGDD